MMKITERTRQGGAVCLNRKHHVWASYSVTRVGDQPPPPLFSASIGLPNGRKVGLFVNRETGLVVVDVVAADDSGGNEVLRLNANDVSLPSPTQERP